MMRIPGDPFRLLDANYKGLGIDLGPTVNPEVGMVLVALARRGLPVPEILAGHLRDWGMDPEGLLESARQVEEEGWLTPLTG